MASLPFDILSTDHIFRMAESFLAFQRTISNDLPITPEFASLLKQVAPSSFLDTIALGIAAAATAAWLLRKYTWDKPDPYHYIYFERPQVQDGFLASRKRVTRNIAQRLEELVSSPTQYRQISPDYFS